MQRHKDSSCFSTVISDQVVSKFQSFWDRHSRNFFHEPLLKFLRHTGGGSAKSHLKLIRRWSDPVTSLFTFHSPKRCSAPAEQRVTSGCARALLLK